MAPTPELIPTEQEYELALLNRARSSLRAFVGQAWPVLEPTTPFKANWHIDCICDHLEAMSKGQIKKLILNVPPGSMKSLLACVFWPAWEWIHTPSRRWLYGTYAEPLAFRDSNKTRDLIKSDWYQSRFGHIYQIRTDQDAQGLFTNDKTGFRRAVGVTSATGQRADRVIWDDPHNIDKGESDTDREAVVNKWRTTWYERVTDEKTAARLIIMQRVHQGDICGWLLDNQDDWEHLSIPTEYEGKKYFSTSLKREDPREKVGDLLWPHHVGPADVIAKKTTLGPYGWAGQHQQRPAPREGGMFKETDFPIVGASPARGHWVRAWDNAATEGAGDYTVGVLMLRAQNIYYVVDVVRGQWGPTERDKIKRETARQDHERYGGRVRIWDVQDPGAAGKDMAAASVRNLAGYPVRTEYRSAAKDAKIVNADPWSSQAGAGNVRVVRAGWNKDFIAEHMLFPNGNYDDQVDAASFALAKLAKLGTLLANWREKVALEFDVGLGRKLGR